MFPFDNLKSSLILSLFAISFIILFNESLEERTIRSFSPAFLQPYTSVALRIGRMDIHNILYPLYSTDNIKGRYSPLILQF